MTLSLGWACPMGPLHFWGDNNISDNWGKTQQSSCPFNKEWHGTSDSIHNSCDICDMIRVFWKKPSCREKFWQKQEQHLGRSVGGPGGISWGPEKSPWKGSPDSHEGNLLFSHYLSLSYFVWFCLTNWICICKNVAKLTKLKSRKSEQIWQLAAS